MLWRIYVRNHVSTIDVKELGSYPRICQLQKSISHLRRRSRQPQLWPEVHSDLVEEQGPFPTDSPLLKFCENNV